MRQVCGHTANSAQGGLLSVGSQGWSTAAMTYRVWDYAGVIDQHVVVLYSHFREMFGLRLPETARVSKWVKNDHCFTKRSLCLWYSSETDGRIKTESRSPCSHLPQLSRKMHKPSMLNKINWYWLLIWYETCNIWVTQLGIINNYYYSFAVHIWISISGKLTDNDSSCKIKIKIQFILLWSLYLDKLISNNMDL